MIFPFLQLPNHHTTCDSHYLIMASEDFHETVVVVTGTFMSGLMVDNLRPGGEQVSSKSQRVCGVIQTAVSMLTCMVAGGSAPTHLVNSPGRAPHALQPQG